MSLQSKLTKGDQVLFQVWNGKPLTLYFDKPLNDKQGFFQDEQRGGPYKKDYKNIIKINGKAINEIKINKPFTPDIHDLRGLIQFTPREYHKSLLRLANKYGWKEDGQNITTYFEQNPQKILPFYNELKKLQNSIQEMTQQQILKEEINNIINQNKQEVLTFESNPLEYILKKYPSLNETLIDLLTKEFRDYITGIFILAPKPTIFKILLHNGQFFYLTYTTQGYTAKVSGKQYSLMNLKEQEYAIKSISNLLLLGLPPGAQGPTEENDNNADMKNNFVADMVSEPDLGLDGVNSSPETTPGEGQPEEEEPLKEQEEPKKITKFRIIK